jgi:nitrogen-specific signal transduction histidine kinase
MEQAMGAPLPNPEHHMPEDMEVQISQLVAQAAPQVLAQSQAMVAQQQAQQNQQDPVMQAQLIDQQVKQGELQRKTQKDHQDAIFKQKELALKEQQIRQEALAKTANVMLTAEDKKSGAERAAKDMEMRDKQHKASTAMEMYKHHTQPPKGGNTE